MENENLEVGLPENPENNMEIEEDKPVSSPDDISSDEVVENVPETSVDVPEVEDIPDTSHVEENENDDIGSENDLESDNGSEDDSEVDNTSEDDLEGDNGSEDGSEGDNTYEDDLESEDGSEDGSDDGVSFFSEDFQNDFSDAVSFLESIDTKVEELLTEIKDTTPVDLWKSKLSELSSTDTLLLMIFMVLFAQFLHNIFKGSRWLRG